MKKIISILLINIFLIQFFIPIKIYAASKNKHYFIVTAYYSPLPNQKHYLKGSYKAEKRLNWEWIKWASWKNVFSGMLAWPKWYNFWTKIYLKWLWIWEISDRWWAIVHAWKRWYKYDRIDLWVWYWEKWLERALYWWKRKIEWYIIKKSNKVSINYKKIPALEWTTRKLKKISNIFNQWIWIKSKKERIIELQNFLQKIWIYNWKIDWIYNKKIIDIIYNFQINNSIIKKQNSYWAGYWWKKTRNLFLQKYINWEFNRKKTITKKQKIEKKEINIFNRPIKTNTEIKKLQTILKQLNLYNWKINWNYSDIKKIILNFQLKNKIIKNKTQLWAWYYWPKTRSYFKKEYNLYLEKQKIKQEELERKKQLENEFKTLENLAQKEAKKEIKLIWKPKFWEISIKVRKLQQKLKELWYFNHKPTAIFGKITKKALINFQISNWIIKNKNTTWLWIFWKKTQKKLKEKLTQIILSKKINKNKDLADFSNINI